MAGKEEVDFDPSKVNATWHVLGHIGLKGFQAGSLLGLFLAIPISAFRHKRGGGALDASFVPRAEKALQDTTLWTATISLLAGLGVLGWKEGWDREKIEDRAYRLHYNATQNRTDNFAAVGGLSGGLAAYALGPKTLNRFSSGLLAGVALGTIAHVATSQSHAEGQVKSAASSAQKVAEELKR